MRIWFDTEFIEDGRTIDLLSIGLVREDGLTYYAECEEADHSKASDWVKVNVLPKLEGGHFIWPRKKIARDLIEIAGERPEFWAYYCSYDWVALCQLFGPMIDLPKGWPMFCRDVKQLCMDKGNPKLPPQTAQVAHNAMCDAIWTRDAWQFLTRAQGDSVAPATAK